MFKKLLSYTCIIVAVCAISFCDTADTDEDGVNDNIDNCVAIVNSGQENSDADRFGDACDNCIYVNNTLQEDSDANGIGDACPCPMSSAGPVVMGLDLTDNFFGFSSYFILEECEDSEPTIFSLQVPKKVSLSFELDEHYPNYIFSYGGIPIISGEISYTDAEGNRIDNASLEGMVEISLGFASTTIWSAFLDGEVSTFMGMPDISPNKVIFAQAGGENGDPVMGLYITDLNSLMAILPMLPEMTEDIDFSENGPLKIIGVLLNQFLKIQNNEDSQTMLNDMLESAIAQGLIDAVDSALPPIIVLMPMDMMVGLL